MTIKRKCVYLNLIMNMVAHVRKKIILNDTFFLKFKYQKSTITSLHLVEGDHSWQLIIM